MPLPSDSAPLRFASPAAVRDDRVDGTIILRSPRPLQRPARAIGEWLVRWVKDAPERTFLAERAADAWRAVTYRETLDLVRRIGQGLLDRELGPGRPLMILSDNSVDHALLSLAALHVGVPVVPVSPAYSLLSQDFVKLTHIYGLVRPGIVWVDDPIRFGPALQAIRATATPLDMLRSTTPTPAVDSAFAALTPDTIAKILFTSGSTDLPKGVINTHRMLCANQEQLASGWRFLEDRPPVLVDWLPWNHTFGGNHNFNLVLRNGGTMYVDGGKAAPGLIDVTARNLKDIASTIHFNVPRGFDLLLPFLERDGDLRRTFFQDLDVLFYASAALPQNLWDRLGALAHQERGGQVAMLSAWGSTETSPLATQVHWAIDRAGVIGNPVPGCELKLVPSGDKLEVRVRGPNVTPGYYKRDDLTAAAFDDEGFYRIGDAVRLADPIDPSKGIIFDGRVAEDFKLSTGTWVNVAAVRLGLIAATNLLIQDAVITGHDRDEIGALVFLSPSATNELAPVAIRDRLAQALRVFARSRSASMCPTRLLIMAEPLSGDANEITDKGYINQGAVLRRREAQVTALYAGGPDVIRPVD